MKTINHNPVVAIGLILMLVALACNVPGLVPNPGGEPVAFTATDTLAAFATVTETQAAAATASPSPTVELPTATITVSHSLVPSTSVEAGKLVYDVTSVDTAAQKRAPYGDSYQINLLERPFLQDMTYVPDMDIASYNLGKDEKFYYVSIELVGANPNNALGINYAVELDLDADGFGDYIIVARPPYNVEWTTDNVQVVQDTSHDTGGLSAEKSDAPLPGDGYDTVIFDGGRGPDDDPDLAWVRVNAGKRATVQFAFKRSLAEDKFMLGVMADGGLKDIAMLDYVDRFTEAEAGSPVKNDEYYPLNELYGVDNVCREAYGFVGTGEEPQRCPPTR